MIALPSSPISCASPSTPPSASSTDGRRLTSGSSDSSSVGELVPLPSLRSKADFPVITAFDPFLTSVKIESNALSMESVSMNVPATIATPRTIAIAVSAVRSFRPRIPLSAKRTISRSNGADNRTRLSTRPLPTRSRCGTLGEEAADCAPRSPQGSRLAIVREVRTGGVRTQQLARGGGRRAGRSSVLVVCALLGAVLLAGHLTAAPRASSGAAISDCTIRGTSGPDALAGTSSDDVICGLGGDDTLRGGGGKDTPFGGAGRDRLIGAAGNDHLRGGPGDDELSGGAGDDNLRGGNGADQFHGGPGADLGDYVSSDEAGGAALGGGGHAGGPGERDHIRSDVENLRGGSGNDTLRGDSRGNWLQGSPGGDRLTGGEGNDRLNGGAGGDRLHGRGSGSFSHQPRCWSGGG